MLLIVFRGRKANFEEIRRSAILKLYFYKNNLLKELIMKPSIHPEIHDVTAHCACGNTFSTTSTLSEINATICSACHPFFTGEQKFLDTAGRIEKFERRYKKGKKA